MNDHFYFATKYLNRIQQRVAQALMFTLLVLCLISCSMDVFKLESLMQMREKT